MDNAFSDLPAKFWTVNELCTFWLALLDDPMLPESRDEMLEVVG